VHSTRSRAARKRAVEHRRARADLHCAPVKERSAQRPRTPSIASPRPCGRANPRIQRFMAFSVGSSTRFAIRGGPAVSGTGSQRVASTAAARHPKALGSPVRDALLRSLQPTSCHEYPPISQLPSVALARFRSLLRPPPLHACAYTRWKRRARLRRRRTIAGTPTPGGDAIVRRVHQLRHLPPSRLRRSLDETQLEGGLPAFLRGERPVRACSASHEPDGHAAGVLCRAPDTARRSEPALEAPRTHPLAMRQHRAVMSPERLPSIDPSNARRASPPHFPWPPLLPRFGRRGAASDMGLRARGAR